MTRRIRVSNLTPTAHGRHVAMLFACHGEVRGVGIVTDPPSRFRGTDSGTTVAVVEMGSEQQGEAAVAALDGRMYCGRNLKVCWEARPAGADPMFGPMNMPEGMGPREAGGTRFETGEVMDEAKAVIAEARAAIIETEARMRRNATGGP